MAVPTMQAIGETSGMLRNGGKERRCTRGQNVKTIKQTDGEYNELSLVKPIYNWGHHNELFELHIISSGQREVSRQLYAINQYRTIHKTYI